jgi:citronellol/citronellal dehydrogenase
VDIRFEDQVEAAVEEAVKTFGGIDILVNNASAISLTGTLETSMKSFDLMHQINARGSFLCTQKCLPHLLKQSNPHVLNLSPPINMDPKWFAGHSAYTLAKYSMSVWVLGMSREFAGKGVAFNALWPRTTIATAAVKNLLGGSEMLARSRTPEIVADAAHVILSRSSKECSGNFFIDEEVLLQEGMKDFEKYAVSPGKDLQVDLFVG